MYNVLTNLVELLNKALSNNTMYLIHNEMSLKELYDKFDIINNDSKGIILYATEEEHSKTNIKIQVIFSKKVNVIMIKFVENSILIGLYKLDKYSVNLINSFDKVNYYHKERLNDCYTNNNLNEILCNLIVLIISSNINDKNIFIINKVKNKLEIFRCSPDF